MLCEVIYQELLVKIKERPIILDSQFGNGTTESEGVLMYCTVCLHMYCMEETKSAVYVGVCVIIHLYEPVSGLNPVPLKIRDGSWWALRNLTSFPF